MLTRLEHLIKKTLMNLIMLPDKYCTLLQKSHLQAV